MPVRARPKYQQLKEILKEEINKRKLRPGDRVPPEEEIGKKYGVSLGTVRQATAELVNEGLILFQKGEREAGNQGREEGEKLSGKVQRRIKKVL